MAGLQLAGERPPKRQGRVPTPPSLEDPALSATGNVPGSALELGDPLSDLQVAPGVESLPVAVAFRGERLGALELPACDAAIRGPVIADAAADRFAWESLRRFFESRLYPALRSNPAAWLAARGLDELIAPDSVARLDARDLHDQVGWGVFLQELWGERRDPAGLYARLPPRRRLDRVVASIRRRHWYRVDLTGELSGVRGPADVVVSVGGAPLGILPVERTGPVEVELLRGAISGIGGYELCRLAVREGLFGRQVEDEGADLRERLRRAAADARDRERDRTDVQGASLELEAPAGIAPAPGWEQAVAAAVRDHAPGLILARHGPDGADGIAVGTSASRRACLPRESVEDLLAAARVAGEPVVRVAGRAAGDAVVLYAPELLWRRRRRTLRRAGTRRPFRFRPPAAQPPDATADRRHRFDAVFSSAEDPWQYTNAYERTKYEQTLSLLPEGRLERALEVGCAEGHFTAQLAPRVGHLVAADISGIALERAAGRCATRSNVDFVRLDLVSDALPGRFDLVVCSETLYFAGDREGLDGAARKLADAVEPGGHLLTANANQVVDDPDSPGFDWGLPFGAQAIGEALAATDSLALVSEIRAPLYRVQLFRRLDGAAVAPDPQVVQIEQPTQLPARVAGTVRWSGGEPLSSEPTGDASTARLPILVYHRVTPAGGGTRMRFLVTPDAFEEQLEYLRSAGFRSVGLETWRRAMEARRPLPGRAVMITFDDAYRDFAEHAWPLLRRYGFGATVFAVTDEVGGRNRWDDRVGEPAPLLDWGELADLRDQGVEVGSHSATHPNLTDLSPAEIVRECARSRAAIAERLGEPPLAFAYPYGNQDGVVEHLVGAVGYRYGLTVRDQRCRLQDRQLAMPRIEVAGEDALPAFIPKLTGSATPAPRTPR